MANRRTNGPVAWHAVIEGLSQATRRPIHRRRFDFWLKIFALSFGMGVVSGIVTAFQFGTDRSVLAERMGSTLGPLLGYEAFVAFLTMAGSFWPYVTPFSVTVEAAAAPKESLEFTFYGAGLIVYPVIILYTTFTYWIFRANVSDKGGYG